jgi:hypothetical protein
MPATAFFTVSGMTADTGYVEITVTNVTTSIVRVSYTKVPQGSASNAAVPTHILSMNDTATYTAISVLADIAVANGATLYADASATFSVSGGYTNTYKLTYQNITDSGAEVDFPGSEFSDSCVLSGNRGDLVRRALGPIRSAQRRLFACGFTKTKRRHPRVERRGRLAWRAHVILVPERPEWYERPCCPAPRSSRNDQRQATRRRGGQVQ